MRKTGCEEVNKIIKLLCETHGLKLPITEEEKSQLLAMFGVKEGCDNE